MAATGDVLIDLPAILDLLQNLPEGRRPFVPDGTRLFGPPTAQATIDRAQALFGSLPQDVIDFYTIANGASLGPFEELGSLELLIKKHGRGKYIHEFLREEAPDDFARFQPRSNNLLVPGSQRLNGCIIELGGPDHGRVMSPVFPEGDYWRTIAWSLSDAVACIRDLYEEGWHLWHDDRPFQRHELDMDVEFERLRPLIDKWRCSPAIAGFYERYWYEPQRRTAPEA